MAPQKDITLCKSISYTLREFRTKRYPGHGGMTKCAKDFGVAVTSWNGWEKGRYIPSDAYQRKLASFMGISVSELRGELPGDYTRDRAVSYSTEISNSQSIIKNQILALLEQCYESTGKDDMMDRESTCCLLLSTGHVIRGVPTSSIQDAETVCMKTGQMTELHIKLDYICAAWFGDITSSGISLKR